MSFFPAEPPADDEPDFEEPQNPRWRPPETELPRIFPIAETLAVTDTVAIIVMCARVYSTGVELVIERRMRRGGRTREEWQSAQSHFHGMYGRPDADRLRYGVALGDGEHVLLDAFPMMDADDEPTGHSLFPTNGSGNGTGDFFHYLDDLWLWPLPPAGPLEIVTQWAAEDIGESRVVIDSAPLIALAASVRPLWEE